MDPAASQQSYQVSDELTFSKTEEIYPGKSSNGDKMSVCSRQLSGSSPCVFRLGLQICKVGRKSLRETDSSKEAGCID